MRKNSNPLPTTPSDEELLCLYADEALPIIAALKHCECDDEDQG